MKFSHVTHYTEELKDEINDLKYPMLKIAEFKKMLRSKSKLSIKNSDECQYENKKNQSSSNDEIVDDFSSMKDKLLDNTSS